MARTPNWELWQNPTVGQPQQYEPEPETPAPAQNKLWTDYSYYTNPQEQAKNSNLDQDYMKYLGRVRQPDDKQFFGMTADQYLPMLRGSQEGKNYQAAQDQKSREMSSPGYYDPPKPGTAQAGTTQYGGTPDPLRGAYAQLPGYDFAKLSNPEHRGPGKYNNDVGMFSQALAATGAGANQQGLQQVHDWLKANGVNVDWNGRDVFKFGDVEVDVMQDYNPNGGPNTRWTFQDPRGKAPAGPPTSSAGPAARMPAFGELPQLGGGNQSWTFNTDGTDQGGNVGTDDFSRLLTSGFSEQINRSLDTLRNPLSSSEFESIRQPIDKARRASLNQSASELAHRGTLVGSGQHAKAAERLESRIAPDFATATARAATTNLQNANQNLLGALRGGTERQAMLGDIALRNLEQNRVWQQFVATFGLTRDQVLHQMQSGDIDQLLHLFEIYANGAI